jgi:3-oxoacyl-[acyl-carrier protein] reductase
VQLAPRKIRVNAVSPGNVLFEGGTWDDKLKRDEQKIRDYIGKNVPLGTFGEPGDIAQAVAFLLDAPFITGHNLIVDGGQTHKFV